MNKKLLLLVVFLSLFLIGCSEEKSNSLVTGQQNIEEKNKNITYDMFYNDCHNSGLWQDNWNYTAPNKKIYDVILTDNGYTSCKFRDVKYFDLVDDIHGYINKNNPAKSNSTYSKGGSSKISYQEARNIAEKYAGLKSLGAKLKYVNGKLVYLVEIIGGRIITVGAYDGTIQ